MTPALIYIRPLDQTTGQRVDVRVADGPTADTYGVGGVQWEPAISTRPKLSIELMSPDMDGRVQAGQCQFELSLNLIFTLKSALQLYWNGASVIIQNTSILEGPTAIPDFWGYIDSARLNLETGRLSVTAKVSTALIDKPLLTGEFTGGSGINGDAALRGTLYPAGFGTVKNIEPVWFDQTRNIGMIDGYANTVSIDWLGEGLSSFGPRVADYATYALLAAAIDAKTVKPGQWATCVAQGLVGLGAPPTGVITVHAVFGTNRAGALMKRILLTHAAVPSGRVNGASFDALDTAVPRNVHYWTSQQRNVKELLEAIAQSCNATPLVSFQNMVSVTRAVVGATAVATLDRSGSVDPRVLTWAYADVDPPFYVLKARTGRPATVLNDDQVNYVDTLEDKGVYDAAVVYRQGQYVWLADGSQWLYQNATPAAGHTPPSTAAPDMNGNVQDAWWFRRQAPKYSTTFAAVAPGATPGFKGAVWVVQVVGGPDITYIHDGTSYVRVANDVTQGSDIGVENGADVTLTAQISIEMQTEKTVAADYTGTVTGTLPVVFSPLVRRNGVSIKLDNTTSYALTDIANGTVTVSNTNGASDKGDVSVSAPTADKVTFTLTVTVAGVAQAPLKCSLTKQKAAAPTGSGSGGGGGTGSASVPTTGSNGTTTYTSAFTAAAPSVVLSSGQKLYATFSSDYDADYGGSGTGSRPRTGTFLAEYSADGGVTKTAFGAAVTGSAATISVVIGGEPTDPVPGHVDLAYNIAGLPPGTYTGYLSFKSSGGSRGVVLQGSPFVLEAKP